MEEEIIEKRIEIVTGMEAEVIKNVLDQVEVITKVRITTDKLTELFMRLDDALKYKIGDKIEITHRLR